MFLPALGEAGIIDTSEGYYAEGAREMVESGNYLIPHLNYRPWFEKPILIYWLLALSYNILGVSELAARLPSALCAIALVPLTYWFCRRFIGRRAAVLAAVCLVSSPLYAVIGHLALTDMPLTFFVAISIMGLFSQLVSKCAISFIPSSSLLSQACMHSHRSSANVGLPKPTIPGFGPALWIAYICLGLGFLLKGPIGLGFPVLVIGSYLVVTYRLSGSAWLSALARLHLLPGVVITALVALPWYAAVTIATNGEFLSAFFLGQNLERIAGHTVHRNPVWYYLPYIAGGFTPWIAVLLLVPGIFLHPLLKRPETISQRQKLTLLAIIWAGLLFILLSLIPTKLSTYILPVFPALAILAGAAIDTIIRLRKSRALAIVFALLIIAGVCMLIALRYFAPPGGGHFVIMLSIGSLLLAGFAIGLALSMRGYTRAPAYIISFCAVFGCMIMVPVGLLSFYQSRHADFHKLIEPLKTSGQSLGLFGPDRYSAAFYLKRRVPVAHDASDLKTLAGLSAGSPGPGANDRAELLLVKDMNLDFVRHNLPDTTPVAHQGRWYLLKVNSDPGWHLKGDGRK